MSESECDGLLNVTCNDISVIYVTAHRCTGGFKNKWNLQSGYQRHRHFVGFFNVPVQAPTRGHPFYGYSEKPLHLVAFTTRWRYGGPILILNPRGPHGDCCSTLSGRIGIPSDCCVLSSPDTTSHVELSPTTHTTLIVLLPIVSAVTTKSLLCRK